LILFLQKKDIVNKERDRMISNHMNRMLNGKHKKGYLDTDFLRKYVYHAKQIKPVLGKEVSDYITNKFVDVRQKQEVEGVELHNITFRQNETLRRLAEASARSRFSKVVERCDVDRAWRVFRGSLESLGMVDLDGWMTQWTVNTRKVLREIEPVLPSSYQTLREMGFSESELDLLIDNNAIFEKEGWYYKRKK
jgi:DNA replicative helicase MCM subunit Mcm2 (Cdc46/Mcm family)